MRILSVLALLGFLSTAGAATVPSPADYVPPFFPEGKPLEGLVITIDAGHGGSSFSPGYAGSSRGVNSKVVEGDLNMRVAGILYHHLKDAGAKVHMTRRDDRKVTMGNTGRATELGARTRLADETASHLFLALHHNAAGRDTADGVMLLIYPTDSKGAPQPLEVAFADALREEVKKTVHQTAPFSNWENDHPLVSGSDIPSAVVEFGFLTNPDFDAWVAGPTAHKAEAIGALNGVIKMWKEHRAELETLRSQLFPNAPAVEIAKPAPSEKPSGYAWPFAEPVADAREAQFLINASRNALLTDRTSVWLKASVDDSQQDWKLTVTTNLPQFVPTLERDLQRASGRKIVTQVNELPSAAVGPEPFGVVGIPMALTWGSPKEGDNVQSQLLLGEPLYLLDRNEAGDYYLVQGIDGYTGWVRAEAVELLGRTSFTELLNRPRARVVANQMDNTFRIPPGAIVDVEPSATPGKWKLMNTVRENAELNADALRFQPSTPLGVTAAEVALREYLYTPYVFGGRSPQGLDCSGLVGGAWAALGLQLPRDAHQQALVGRIVATAWHSDALSAGDILFFVDENGRVYHTGVSLGGSRFVHASPPEVQISSIDPADPLYAEGWHKQFFIARRPLE